MADVSAQVQGFHPATFISQQTEALREAFSGKKAIAAISGGIDSTIAAFLAKQALGDNMIPVLIDTGFMRLNEAEEVRAKLSSPPLNLKVRLVRAGGKFLTAIKDEPAAEEKRKKFRETFYQTLREEAEKEGCEYVVQGTIAPDWIETQGGIKTQHNILEQVGIDPLTTYGFKIIEPLADLYKDQVRSLGRHVELPIDLAERQPFPGPGLLVRCIGTVTRDKLQALKIATKIVEQKLGPLRFDQYFAAVIDRENISYPSTKSIREVAAKSLGLPSNEVQVKIFEDRVTGVKGDERCYGRLVGVKLRDDSRETYGWLPDKLRALQASVVEKFADVTRVVFLVKERRGGGRLSVLVRAVSTRDFMTAAVSPVSWKTLKDVADEVLKTSEVGRVYYDVTPKPPATIEFE